MAAIYPTGANPTTLTEYINLINQVFINVFGSAVNLDPETPQGQFIGLIAFAMSQVDESIIDTFNASNINDAIGQQLDALCGYLRIPRQDASATEVDVQLTGVPATFIEAGSRASDTDGDQFFLQSNVTLDGSGNGSGVMVCTVTGPIPVPINALNQIVTVVPGWETVNNSAAGNPGSNKETDFQYYLRYLASVKINSVTPTGAIQAALLAISDLTWAQVVENDTSAPIMVNGQEVSAKAVACVVVGGTDEEVGTAIGQKKTLGCGTDGNHTYSYVDPGSGVPKAINFYRATEVPIEIHLNISIFPNFPGGGLQQIIDNLLGYFTGTFQVSPGFGITGQSIGQNVVYTRLFTPVNEVVGMEINSMTICAVGGTPSAADVEIILTEYATLIADNIDIVVA